VYLNAQYFFRSPDYETRFFAFDDGQKIFVEVDFAEIQDKIERERQVNPQDELPSVGRSLKQLLKAAPRAVVRRIPSSVKRRVPVEIKQGLKGGYRLGKSLFGRTARALHRRIRPVAPTDLAQLEFGKNSTVLILGKTWDYPDMIPTLGRLKLRQGFRLIHLVHDMIPVFQPHTFGHGLFEPYTKTMFEVCSLSDGLLVQSKATAKDVRRFCDELLLPKPPIQVVRLGDEIIQIDLPEDEPSPDSRIKRGEFILQVGTIEARKNHQLVYLAYREAVQQGVDLPIWVVVGSSGWLTGDVLWQMQHDPLVKDKIICLGGVSDRVKLWLFRNCRFTVYPSTYEGWGMPVTESLAYGKVCITSNTSSLPEAGGEFADQVSPYNTQELLTAMLRYMDDKVLAAREKQIAAFRPASWDGMSEQIDAFVRSLSK
jgi:glycosyltransferase involved in cell wall biosynthesis